jgi:uncharacterized repeat protein (TIGR01451 family)/fimbrial isopeptide formation D2 family protein
VPSGRASADPIAGTQPALTKSGQVISGPNKGSTTQAGPGDTIQWKVGYAAPTTLGGNGMNITDGLQSGQVYVPGSLEVPKGWTAQYSSDGTTYSNGAAPATVAGLAATAQGDGLPTTQGTSDFGVYTQNSHSTTGGDGYIPVPIGDNVYNSFHHQQARLFCTVKSSGQPCANYPARGYWWTTDGLIAGGPSNIDGLPTGTTYAVTPNVNVAGMNADSTKLYFAASLAYYDGSGSTVKQATPGHEFGLVCFDISGATPTSCGFTKMGTGAESVISSSGGHFQGLSYDPQTHKYLAAHLSEAGTAATDNTVYCMDLSAATPQPCGTVALTPALNGRISNLETFQATPVPGTHKIMINGTFGSDATASPAVPATVVTQCVDASAAAVICSGWPADGHLQNVADKQTSSAPIITYTTGGVANGVCTVLDYFRVSIPDSLGDCYTLTGGAASAATVMPNAATALLFSEENSSGSYSRAANTTFSPAPGLVRSYHPVESSQGSSYVACYDWSTQQACANWPLASTSQSQDIKGYGIVNDDQNPQCLWELGDRGVLTSFDAMTGGPCGSAVGLVPVTPTDYYCAGDTGHVTGYSEMTLAYLKPGTDFSSASMTIRDAKTGAVITTRDVKAQLAASYNGGTGRSAVDISQLVNYAQHPSITVSLSLGGVDTSAFSKTPKPTVTVSWKGDAAEMCYKTTAPTDCLGKVTSLNNTASLAYTKEDGSLLTPAPTASASLRYVAAAAACPAVSIVKDDHQTFVNPGENTTYDLTVSNTSAVDASGVVVTDALPAQLDFVSATDGGTYNPATRTVTWNLGTVAAGTNKVVHVTATVNAASPADATITNTAKVDTDQGCTVASDCNTTDTDRTPPAVSIVKDDHKTVVKPGDQTTYDIVVTNHSKDQLAEDVVVKDVLPAELEFVSATDDGSYDASSRTVTWNLGDLGAGGSRTVHVTAKVAASTPLDSTITNIANVTDKDGCLDEQACNASDVDRTPPPVSITKDDHKTVVGAGEKLTYDLTVTNKSNQIDAHDVVVTDPLPKDLTFVSAANGGVYDAATRTVTWKLGTLAKGASVKVQVTATVTSGAAAGASIANTATVQTAEGCVGTDDCSSTDTDHTPDVSIVKDDHQVVVSPGGQLTYDLTVTNNADWAATGVVVTDPIPTKVTFASASDGGVYNSKTRTVTWTLGELAGKAQKVVQVTVTVSNVVPSGTYQLVNTATVTTDQGCVDKAKCTSTDVDRVDPPGLVDAPLPPGNPTGGGTPAGALIDTGLGANRQGHAPSGWLVAGGIGVLAMAAAAGLIGIRRRRATDAR